MSDPENNTYISTYGKAKRIMWPKSDKGLEQQKAMSRKRILRLQRHLVELKQKHQEFYGASNDEEVIDSDAGDRKYFIQTMSLNPLSGAEWVEGRSAMINAIDHVAVMGKTRGAWIKEVRKKIIDFWRRLRATYDGRQYNEMHLIK